MGARIVRVTSDERHLTTQALELFDELVGQVGVEKALQSAHQKYGVDVGLLRVCLQLELA